MKNLRQCIDTDLLDKQFLEYCNSTNQGGGIERLNDLLLIKECRINVKHRESTYVIFRHKKIENIQLYTAKRLVEIEVEGPEDGFFGKTQNSSATITNINTTTTSNLNGYINNCTTTEEGDIDPIVFNTRNCKKILQ